MEKLFIAQARLTVKKERKKWLRICYCMHHLDINKMAMGWAVLQNIRKDSTTTKMNLDIYTVIPR